MRIRPRIEAGGRAPVYSMNGFFQRVWTWLEPESNRGRVVAIAVAVGALITAVTLAATLLTPPGEVRMSVSDFQDELSRRAEEVRGDLTTAHGEERIRLANENAEIARRLADVQAAYAERQERIDELEASLARFADDIDEDLLTEARTALGAGDFSKADALLADIEASTDAAVASAAEAAFQRGRIAATRIRWSEAAAHFDNAARLDPTYDHINQAGSFASRTGQYAVALRHFEDLLELSHHENGEKSPKTATALNNLASLLKSVGRYEEAEPLFRQALAIGRETLGDRHPDYATRLNNLAALLRDTDRSGEAEPFLRQALKIDRETLGEGHPAYATRLNNLASLLDSKGRYEEAEPLYRQALEIVRATLGDDHPDTRLVGRNYARLLRAWFPHNPALAELRSAFGEDVGEP